MASFMNRKKIKFFFWLIKAPKCTSKLDDPIWSVLNFTKKGGFVKVMSTIGPKQKFYVPKCSALRGLLSGIHMYTDVIQVFLSVWGSYISTNEKSRIT